MRPIQTLNQLKELQNETYVYAIIVAILIFGVAFMISNMIPYQGDNDRSYIKRRIWWIVCMVVGALGFWLYNDLYISSYIKKVAFQNQFSTTNMVCLAVTLFGSALLSLVVMLCFRHSKFGTILGKEKN